jgi:uncharacterized protein (DUF885 family)
MARVAWMTIHEISDDVVRELAAMSPLAAVYLGLPSDRLLDDLSPSGLAEQAELAARTVAAAAQQPIESERDRVAADVLTERLQLHLDRYEAGDFHSALNVIASPLQDTRMLFDLLPKETDEQYADIAARMRALPESFGGYVESLREGVRRGRVSAIRQVDKCAEQCDTYSGAGDGDGYFTSIAKASGCTGALASELADAATTAEAAYADLASFLRSELRQHAPAKDAVGREVYSLASRDFLGASIDLEETYEWGWKEFLGLEAELKAVCERIHPGAAPREVSDELDDDPRHQVTGTDALQRWMQQLSDEAVDELGRTHFEIPDPIRTLDCKIAPPGGTVGAYYTGPSDDLSRPGAMWWSVEQGREVFPTWREVTVVYHEGVPGHHLQIATAVHERASLNDFQRLLAGTSGHAEGWALYAERLMRELGYLDDDPVLLGMLDGQLFRAARVVVDIGMHLELEIPGGTDFHEGERWTPDLGLEFLLTRTVSDTKHCADEIDRYLGWPGQAPSYKVGERVWIDGRDAARARRGDDFDFKAFHTTALQFGGMGLDPLAALLDTI